MSIEAPFTRDCVGRLLVLGLDRSVDCSGESPLWSERSVEGRIDCVVLNVSEGVSWIGKGLTVGWMHHPHTEPSCWGLRFRGWLFQIRGYCGTGSQ